MRLRQSSVDFCLESMIHPVGVACFSDLKDCEQQRSRQQALTDDDARQHALTDDDAHESVDDADLYDHDADAADADVPDVDADAADAADVVADIDDADDADAHAHDVHAHDDSPNDRPLAAMFLAEELDPSRLHWEKPHRTSFLK